MISLNLLPAEAKHRVRQSIYASVVRVYVTWILVVLAIIGGVIYLNTYLLSQEVNDLDIEISLASKATSIEQGGSLQENIVRLNTEIRTIDEVQKDYTPMAQFLSSFVATIPAGITITTLQVDVSTRVLVLQGVAATRADLIAFREVIRGNEVFTSSDLPISDLTQRSDILFDASGILKPNFWMLTP